MNGVLCVNVVYVYCGMSCVLLVVGHDGLLALGGVVGVIGL